MLKHVKTNILTVFLVITVLSVGLLGYYYGALGAYVGDVGEVWVQPPFHEAGYVIGVYNSTFYYGMNGTTGEYEWLSTNDDTVLQNAIDTTNSLGGGSVYVKGGTYTASVTTKANVLLILDAGVSGVSYTVDSGGYCMRYVGGYVWFEQPVNMTGHEIKFGAFHTGTSGPSSPNTGQWWYDTNTYNLKIYNGTDWATVQGAQGPAGSPGTGGYGEYQYIVYQNGSNTEFRDWLGQLQDSSTNDASIINYAISNCTSDGSVFLKAASYSIASTIVINEEITFYGEGYGKTTLLATTSLNPVVEITTSGVHVRDLTIDCDNSGIDGIEVLAANCRLTRIEVIDPTQDGIVLGNSVTTYTGGRVDFCRVSNADRYGIHVTNDFSDSHIVGNLVRGYINNNPSACLALAEGSCFISENHFWGAHNAIRANGGCDSVVINLNWLDDTYRHNIHIASGGRISHSVISNNEFRDANRAATFGVYDSIYIDGTFSYNSITGNYFTGWYRDYSTPHARYAIYATGSYGAYCTVTGNVFTGYDGATPWVRLAGSGNEYAANIGYTES